MNKKYIIRLSEVERVARRDFVKWSKGISRIVKRDKRLLKPI